LIKLWFVLLLFALVDNFSQFENLLVNIGFLALKEIIKGVSLILINGLSPLIFGQ